MSENLKLLHYILFIGITFFSIEEGIAQEGEIVYRAEVLDKFAQTTDLRAKKINREISLQKYSLRYTRDVSFYDQLPYVPEYETSARIAQITAHFTAPYYQDPIQRETYQLHKIKDKQYTVSSTYRMQNWKFTNESKVIDGYNTLKATLSVYDEISAHTFEMEAWYTPEIPLPYGPAGFGGLPGLILELKYSPVVLVAEKITQNPRNGIKKIKVPSKENIISTSEFVKLMRANRKVTPN